jgi:hypothetical protein
MEAAVDNHVYDRVRCFLVGETMCKDAARAGLPEEVYGELGVLLLKGMHIGSPP